MKERIEIFPGKWIEVTKRIKKIAGVRMSTRVRATLDGGQIDKAVADVERTRRKNVKYSRLIIDEAVAIARTMGMENAVKKTGVNKWTIEERKKQLRGPRNVDGGRYTLTQKRGLVRLAQDLIRNGGTIERKWGRRILTVPRWAHREAFIEAGRRMGMNGRVIEYQWVNGFFTLTDAPSSPPPASQSQAVPAAQPAR